MLIIKLNYHEIITAAMGGVLRQLENMRDGRMNTHGLKKGEAHDWQLHIEGCLGELAVAKAMNLYWSKGQYGADDVGDFQVRTTRRDQSDLILHPRDPDDKRFYLVTGYNGRYKICGWILGRDGKKLEYWKDPAGGRPAFFVPQSALTDAQIPEQTDDSRRHQVRLSEGSASVL